MLQKFELIRTGLKGSDVDVVPAQQVNGSDEWKANCPYHHDEDTPSLFINSSKRIFYCHGCQAKGKLKDEEVIGSDYFSFMSIDIKKEYVSVNRQSKMCLVHFDLLSIIIV